MENKEVAISLRGITKTFGDVTANSNVNLDVYKGEILSLLEKNIVKSGFLDANEPADLKFFKLCTAVVVSLNEYFGGTYIDQKVVVDGNLITARSVASAILFSYEIIRKLLGEEALKAIYQQVYEK